MEAEWSLPDVPALLEDAGRNTAENASRSLPIVRAIGEIRRVTVVTSAWHIRAPYFFAPYRAFGLRLSFRFTAHGSWPRMLWHELAEPAGGAEGAPPRDGRDAAAPRAGVAARRRAGRSEARLDPAARRATRPRRRARGRVGGDRRRADRRAPAMGRRHARRTSVTTESSRPGCATCR